MTPSVSVIMSVYNSSSFLEEAIRSVQAQTIDDWELIVMDDGNHRAQILTTDGEFLHTFGSRLFTRPIRHQE